jgi:hypothetical protein
MPSKYSADGTVRCPQCGTTRLRIRTKPDRIDRILGNAFLNKVRAWRGDILYHCIYCRLQFYYRRKWAGPESADSDESEATVR